MDSVSPDHLLPGSAAPGRPSLPKVAYLGCIPEDLKARFNERSMSHSLNLIRYVATSESQFLSDVQDPTSALSGVSAILRLGTEASTGLPQGWTSNLIKIPHLPPRLRLLVNLGHGLEKENVTGAAARGITVAGTGGGTDATATVAVYLVISVFRGLSSAERAARAGDRKEFVSAMYRASASGRDPQGKTVCIFGYGRIGQRIGQLLGALGMRVCAVRRTRRVPSGDPLTGVAGDGGVMLYDSLDDVIGDVDCLVLACPYTEATHHIVNWAMITRMKPGARVVNVARGRCVDEEALVRGLETGILSGVGLDVYENEPSITPELLKLDSAVLLPHIGGLSVECTENHILDALDTTKEFIYHGADGCVSSLK